MSSVPCPLLPPVTYVSHPPLVRSSNGQEGILEVKDGLNSPLTQFIKLARCVRDLL